MRVLIVLAILPTVAIARCLVLGIAISIGAYGGSDNGAGADAAASGTTSGASSGERSVEVWTRGAADAWVCSASREGEVARLASIGARLDVRELYGAAAEPA